MPDRLGYNMGLMNHRLKIAVIGVGRMGRHHARIYTELPQVQLVGVVDTDQDRGETVGDECHCPAYESCAALCAEHDDLAAVSIAVPTQYHIEVALPLLQRRIACLVEKPLAPSLEQARQLVHCARENKAILQVGHTERFNPAVRAVCNLELTPRFIQVDRVSPMTFRSLDTSVVMDMMIHDLDIVLMLARSNIRKVDAAGVTVLGEHEDVANARIVFGNGCVANLTASRLAMKTERKLRLVSEMAYVRLDYHDQSGIIIRRSDPNATALQSIRARLAAGEDLSNLDYSDMIEIDDLGTVGTDDPLTAELTSFADCIAGRQRPVVTAEDGCAAVDAAERVLAAIRSHQWDGLGSHGLEMTIPSAPERVQSPQH